MGRVLFVLLFLPAAIMAGTVLPCASGTLVDYINLGSEGCTIGATVVFDFFELTIPTGSTPIDSAAIGVDPVNLPFKPTLQFTVNVTAGAGQFLDTRFAYSVTSLSPMVGLDLLTPGMSASLDGATTVITDACLGDVFFFDSCFASTDTLITFATEFDSSNSATTTFPPTLIMGIANDIGVDGGLFGSAAIGTVTNQINQVPEPATAALCAAGLIAASWLRRRR